ncbi:MAG: response regulator, partial [Chloroflexi bacterium]|nr:response regulator [Chloroflexota bacterium]
PMRSKGHLVGTVLVGTERSSVSQEELEALLLTADQAAVAIENAQLYEREQTGRRVADTLLAASATLSSTLDLQQVLDLVLQQLEVVIPYDTAMVLLRDEDKPVLQAVAVRGKAAEDARGFRLQVDRNALYQEMQATRQPVVIPDIEADPRWEAVPAVADARSWIGAPLIAKGNIIGELALFHSTRGFYAWENPTLLLGFAHQAAAALENARLYARLRTQMAELHRAQTRLIQAEKLSAIGQLVSGVAHELNNPLTSVLGYAQMLVRNRQVSPDVQDDLQRIATQASRAAGIVRNLLDFAREQPPAKRWISINDLLERTLALRSYELSVSNTSVIKRLEPTVPNTMADPQQMQQVFLNIILNAEQALVGHKGGGRLTVRTGVFAAPGTGEQVLRIEFSDNGPGIPGEILQRIFDPFFTTKDVGRGTGLGLSIAYGYVTEHGGLIWAENNNPPEAGATFYVELPILGPETVVHPVDERVIADPPEVVGRILVVEDEELVASLFQRVLQARGYQVWLAADGRQALEMLRAREYDLVISDVKMPGMNGTDLHGELRRLQPILADHTIFITGDTVSRETRQFLEQAGVPHLTKPVDLDAMEQAVSQMLKRRKQVHG